SWRGRGIQRALIAARARQAEAEGALHLVAQTHGATAAGRNLAAMGLTPLWTRHDYRYEVAPAPEPPEPAASSTASSR
ncbi:MAG TPA: hypothetical protein VMH24_03165, partial [Candidatus Sulfotelmatobacter sp.]|nr:hypothetical protein [Candidatus Sulfotelmatobacter sp.]